MLVVGWYQIIQRWCKLMSKLVSLPAAIQLEFNTNPEYESFDELYVCNTCEQCINNCEIYTISSDAEIFCVKYQKIK